MYFWHTIAFASFYTFQLSAMPGKYTPSLVELCTSARAVCLKTICGQMSIEEAKMFAAELKVHDELFEVLKTIESEDLENEISRLQEWHENFDEDVLAFMGGKSGVVERLKALQDMQFVKRNNQFRWFLDQKISFLEALRENSYKHNANYPYELRPVLANLHVPYNDDMQISAQLFIDSIDLLISISFIDKEELFRIHFIRKSDSSAEPRELPDKKDLGSVPEVIDYLKKNLNMRVAKFRGYQVQFTSSDYR